MCLLPTVVLVSQHAAISFPQLLLPGLPRRRAAARALSRGRPPLARLRAPTSGRRGSEKVCTHLVTRPCFLLLKPFGFARVKRTLGNKMFCISFRNRTKKMVWLLINYLVYSTEIFKFGLVKVATITTSLRDSILRKREPEENIKDCCLF